jgi:hypothetical protein
MSPLRSPHRAKRPRPNSSIFRLVPDTGRFGALDRSSGCERRRPGRRIHGPRWVMAAVPQHGFNAWRRCVVKCPNLPSRAAEYDELGEATIWPALQPAA